MPIDLSTRTLRLTLGTSAAFGIGQLVGWRMSFIVPVLAVSLLKSPARPTLRAGLGFVLIIVLTFAIALTIVLPLLNYPLVAMPVLVLMLFWTFYLGQRGASPFLVMMLLMALTLVPVLGLGSIDLSVEIARTLSLSGLLAVLFTWLAFTFLPAAPSPVRTPGANSASVTDRARKVRLAWVSTLVVSPLFLVIMNFGLTSQVLVLVFVTLLSVQPDLSRGMSGGMGLIAGNLLGGAIAIVIYKLAVILPNLLFLTLLMAVVCLILGRRIFQGGAAGAICGTALTTVLIIIGMTVAPIGPDADAKFLSRIVQVTAAAVYVAGAFALVSTVVKKDDGLLAAQAERAQ